MKVCISNWKSQKQRQTAIQILKILTQTRADKRKIKKHLEDLREKEQNSRIYETDHKINRTLEKMVEEPEYPVSISDRGHFFERTDRRRAY